MLPCLLSSNGAEYSKVEDLSLSFFNKSLAYLTLAHAECFNICQRIRAMGGGE